MRRYLRFSVELTLAPPARVKPQAHFHDEHDASEGITFCAFGSALNVVLGLRRGWV